MAQCHHMSLTCGSKQLGGHFLLKGLLASRELRVQVGTSDKFHAAGCMAFAEEPMPISMYLV